MILMVYIIDHMYSLLNEYKKFIFNYNSDRMMYLFSLFKI